MGRKRKDLGADAEQRIAALVTRGANADAVAAAFGISPATAKRRMREVRSGITAARKERRAAAPEPAPPSSDALPVDADEIPPEAGLAQIEHWLAVAQRNAHDAEVSGEIEALAKFTRLAVMLLEARRKATPVPKADPNEHPDYVEAAARVRARWHKLIDQAAARKRA